MTLVPEAPGATGSALAAYSWETGGSKQVVYFSGDGHVHELAVSIGGRWTHTDLTQATGAPVADRTRLGAYSWEGGGSKQVIYTTGDHHIHELFRRWAERGATPTSRSSQAPHRLPGRRCPGTAGTKEARSRSPTLPRMATCMNFS
ncbi:MAG TPA: hypothetical protein VMJ75_30560 [Candidatus Acidoferrales bacterium]|nr:hypothetical protein [Candidatus Acidoferrales bacterium]